MFCRGCSWHHFPAILLLLLSGCNGSAPIPGSISARSVPDGNRCEQIDAIGRRVTLPRHPDRIVSLAPSVTEVLYLLGISDRLIGVTTHCDWPEDARQKPKIGDLLNPDAELILAARPDLIIASTAGNDRSAVLKLAGLGLPVFVTAPRSVATILETVEQIGRITDSEDRGQALAAAMKQRLDALDRRLAGVPMTRLFYITWFEPLLAPGQGTFENDLLRHAGAESITSGIAEFYPRYSLEQLIAQDPDVVVAARHEGAPLPDLKSLSGWGRLRAVREGRVYLVSQLLQHPSPRFVDALEDLARRLHPERFR
ncbi:MAG: cobalamin-binding protein [Acidobacteria bacterium]|nr:cobalamin-binding protein [Acidobacteriota bacterium]